MLTANNRPNRTVSARCLQLCHLCVLWQKGKEAVNSAHTLDSKLFCCKLHLTFYRNQTFLITLALSRQWICRELKQIGIISWFQLAGKTGEWQGNLHFMIFILFPRGRKVSDAVWKDGDSGGISVCVFCVLTLPKLGLFLFSEQCLNIFLGGVAKIFRQLLPLFFKNYRKHR